jgi:hypothetical protein
MLEYRDLILLLCVVAIPAGILFVIVKSVKERRVTKNRSVSNATPHHVSLHGPIDAPDYWDCSCGESSGQTFAPAFIRTQVRDHALVNNVVSVVKPGG